MFSVDKNLLALKAAQTGFNRDTLEKVYRLVDILDFVNRTPQLNDKLVLKGGTAINLAVFEMPRLSVDIDMDLDYPSSKEDMENARLNITIALLGYAKTHGYVMNKDKTKDRHALNSWVFEYTNSVGNKDNIKIEVNCMMRNHILPPLTKTVAPDFLLHPIQVKTLHPIELFGSKIKALVERTAARDLYDIHNMINTVSLNGEDELLLKKCFLFYYTVGATNGFSSVISFDNIDQLQFSKVKQTLIPVLRKTEKIDIDSIKSEVREYLDRIIVLTEREKEYLSSFELGKYKPELLFDDANIVNRIIGHPMAMWKTQNHARTNPATPQVLGTEKKRHKLDDIIANTQKRHGTQQNNAIPDKNRNGSGDDAR